jgi:hypothetical protein
LFQLSPIYIAQHRDLACFLNQFNSIQEKDGEAKVVLVAEYTPTDYREEAS